MSRKKLDFRADAFRNVLGFTFKHWQGQPWRVALIALLVILATLAEALSPLFAGQLVDAVADGNNDAMTVALTAFVTMSLLYLANQILSSNLKKKLFLLMDVFGTNIPVKRGRCRKQIAVFGRKN